MVFFQQKRQNHCNCDKCTNIQGGDMHSTQGNVFGGSSQAIPHALYNLRNNKMKKPHGKLPNVHPK